MQFSDTVADRVGSVDTIVAKGAWDLRLETKHRVWTPFWDALLGTVLKDEKVAARLEHLKFQTQDVGKVRIVDHFRGMAYNPSRAAQRVWVQQQLEGVDAYWTGALSGGSSRRATNFGRMYVVPYPFKMTMVYDDGDGYSFITEEDFDRFVAENLSPETLRRRGIRRQLRALSGCHVYFDHVRQETHTVRAMPRCTVGCFHTKLTHDALVSPPPCLQVPDGMEEYTNDKGERRTRERRTAVSVRCAPTPPPNIPTHPHPTPHPQPQPHMQVTMYYSQGTFSATERRSDVMAEGFSVSLTLTDGHGTAVAPHTGMRHEIRNTCTVGEDVMGITTEYAMTAPLSALLGRNAMAWQTNIGGMEARFTAYRTDLMAKRAADEATLSSAFWLHVYDADTLPRAGAEYYFMHCETNPVLQKVPERFRAELDFLYNRMAVVRYHPCAAFWFLFFHDVWVNNKDVATAFTTPSGEALMDPSKPTALAFTPLPRRDLEAKLGAAKLLGRRSLFTPHILDVLYAQLDATDKDFVANAARIVRPAPAPGHPGTPVPAPAPAPAPAPPPAPIRPAIGTSV